MFRFNACRDCFKVSVDDTASDRYLLLSKAECMCDICHKPKHVVVQYFKYGEQEVTENGRRLKYGVKHIGVNPNYSCWGDQNPYKETRKYIKQGSC